MSKIDFVIVGFPKCGTTSLVDNLNKHSKINIYSTWLYNEAKTFKNNNFNEINKLLVENKLNGEKNHSYLWDIFALNNIKNYNPNMKIIICLRNPVDYLYSWYHQLYFNNNKCDCIFCKINNNEIIDEKDKKILEDNENKRLEIFNNLKEIEEEYKNLLSDEIIELTSDSEEESEKKYYDKQISFQEFYENQTIINQSYFVNHIIKAKEIFKNNIHFVIQEEYRENNKKELNKIFNFLGLEEEKIENLSSFKGNRPNGDLDNKTRYFLTKKYKEHNENLFKIIGRKINIWEKINNQTSPHE